MSAFEREIDAMKMALGVELDRELAIELKIDPSAVAAWRRRGRVPEKYKIRFKIIRDEALSAELTGVPAGLRHIYIFSLISTASVLIDRSGYFLAEETENFEHALMAQRIGRFYSHLILTISPTADKADLRATYDRLRGEMLAADDILIWLDEHAGVPL